MDKISLNTQIILTLILLAFTLVFFQFTNADIYIQDYIFDFSSLKWMVDKRDKIYSFIFYSGIKKLIISFGVFVLFALIFLRKKSWVKSYKKGLMVVLLSAITIPLSVGILKATTNTPCPKNIKHFNGNHPDVKLFDSYPPTFKQSKNIKCFPAGHASGGFALLSLVFLFKSRKNRILAFLFAQSIGWSMGIYKMLIGDHFLSHTIVTMLLAWLIVLVSVKFIESNNNFNIRSNSQL